MPLRSVRRPNLAASALGATSPSTPAEHATTTARRRDPCIPWEPPVFVLAPTGLAVGLAPNDWRYAGPGPAIRPWRPGHRLWVPRSPASTGDSAGLWKA